MSPKAVKKVPFIAKGPNNRHELSRILELAGRLIDRPGADATSRRDGPPSNIIAFPGPRS